jgi:hypothetical protein
LDSAREDLTFLAESINWHNCSSLNVLTLQYPKFGSVKVMDFETIDNKLQAA